MTKPSQMKKGLRFREYPFGQGKGGTKKGKQTMRQYSKSLQ